MWRSKCAGWELNPHALRHMALNHACLPIPAPAQTSGIIIGCWRLSSKLIFIKGKCIFSSLQNALPYNWKNIGLYRDRSLYTTQIYHIIKQFI
jgi:hypothetical protein